MAVDFSTLRDSNPGSLSDVAGQWGRAKGKLNDAHRASTGVEAKMSNGEWRGTAAIAAVKATGDYSGQLSAGETEADTIKSIIENARKLLVEAKDKLDKVVEDIDADDSLRVDDAGKVTVELTDSIVEMVGQVKAEVISAKEQKAAELEAKITEIVADAKQVDSDTALSLRTACDYDSGSSKFNDAADNGWVELKTQRFGDGTLVEGKMGAGWRDNLDLGQYGSLKLMAGAEGNVGAYEPDAPGEQSGGWGGVFAGLDATYDAPATDLGLDGVSANLDPKVQIGTSQSAAVNDPRVLNIDHEGSDVRIQSNILSHSFEKVPVTVAVDVDVSVDLEEVQDNFRLPTVPPPPGFG